MTKKRQYWVKDKATDLAQLRQRIDSRSLRPYHFVEVNGVRHRAHKLPELSDKFKAMGYLPPTWVHGVIGTLLIFLSLFTLMFAITSITMSGELNTYPNQPNGGKRFPITIVSSFLATILTCWSGLLVWRTKKAGYVLAVLMLALHVAVLFLFLGSWEFSVVCGLLIIACGLGLVQVFGKWPKQDSSEVGIDGIPESDV